MPLIKRLNIKQLLIKIKIKLNKMTENKFNRGDYVVYKNKKKMIKGIYGFINGLLHYELLSVKGSIKESDLKPYAEITKTTK